MLMWMHVDNGDFYDFSGPAANYSNNEDRGATYYPAILGKALQFTFTSFNTERSFDKLYVYDGTSASATLIGTFSGTTGPAHYHRHKSRWHADLQVHFLELPQGMER